MKTILIAAAALGALAGGGCEAETATPASTPTPASAPSQNVPPRAVAEAFAAQDDAAIAADDELTAEALRRFGRFYYQDGDWRPTLLQFSKWVSDRQGYSRFAIDEGSGRLVVFMQLTWTYEDGRPADLGFVFAPNPRTGEAALMQGYRGETRMSAQESEEAISGIVLDMYHTGMLPPS